MALADALATNATVESFNMSWNLNMGQVVGERLVESLKSNWVLREMECWDSGFGGETEREIKRLLGEDERQKRRPGRMVKAAR